MIYNNLNKIPKPKLSIVEDNTEEIVKKEIIKNKMEYVLPIEPEHFLLNKNYIPGNDINNNKLKQDYYKEMLKYINDTINYYENKKANYTPCGQYDNYIEFLEFIKNKIKEVKKIVDPTTLKKFEDLIK